MKSSTLQKILFVLLILWAGAFLYSFRIPNADPFKPTPLPSTSGSSNGGDSFNKKRSDGKDTGQETPSHFPKELAVTLLNWKRQECLQTIITRMQDYSDFITEILIGNNNPDVIITEADFKSQNIPLRIYNFPQNRLFYARYELCLMASGKYCYFQDDDWENRHLRSLYANFLRYPHLLHTDTNAFVHYLSWAWTFFEPSVNMQTGFSWLGTGGIASLAKVRTFIETQIPLIPRESCSLADMYFSTWFNQVPYQLENELIELEKKFGFSSEPGGIKRNKLHMSEGVKMLYSKLKDNSSLFTHDEQHPIFEERYTKSPCDQDDCLFTTSLHSFPNPRQIIYEPRWDIDTSEFLHGQLFDHNLFEANPYHHAVDDKLETSWVSLKDVEKGDFFGLDLLHPDHYTNIYVEVGHDYQSQLVLENSLDGTSWSNETCEWDKSVTNQGKSVHYWLKSVCECPLRFIRFRAVRSHATPIQVFDIHYQERFTKWPAQQRKTNSSLSCEQRLTVPQIVNTQNTPYFLREIGNGEIPVTLVLLHWKRLGNFPTIFEYLSQYKFINEYIIWNNNVEVQITTSHIFHDSVVPEHVNLRIVNSPQNLHDFAKYMACSMATNKYCYFQDDDWLNVYMHSQYSQFLRFPDIFHSITIPIINLEHRRWNIYNGQMGLHAGFSWLGVGSFIPRDRANKFLEQLSQIQIKQNEMLQADIFFSYMTNDYPWEMPAIAHPLNQTGAWSAAVDQWTIVYSRLSIAATNVLKLLENGNKIISTAPPNPAYSKRDVRAPCINDKCLFLTNVASFPDPEEVIYDGSKTIKQQEEVYNALEWPTNWFWMENSYERAVDGDPFTCWTSFQVAKEGSYFGLDLLHHKQYTKFTVVVDHDISKYDVSVSPNALSWEKIEYTVRQARMLAGPIRSYSLSVDYPRPFRFIQFEAQAEIAHIRLHTSVYEVYEGDVSGTFLSFGLNKVLNPSFETPFSESDNDTDAVDWYIQHPAAAAKPDVRKYVDVENKKMVVAHTGTRALRFSSPEGTSSSSASQVVELYQKIPRKLIVSAASKAEGVVNMRTPEAGYALVLDLTFMDGTAMWDAYVSVFNQGTHTWQFKTIAVDLDREIKTVTVHLFFKNHRGTAYFDDVYVQEEQW